MNDAAATAEFLDSLSFNHRIIYRRSIIRCSPRCPRDLIQQQLFNFDLIRGLCFKKRMYTTFILGAQLE